MFAFSAGMSFSLSAPRDSELQERPLDRVEKCFFMTRSIFQMSFCKAAKH